LKITGTDLDIEGVVAVARGEERVEPLEETVITRMRASRAWVKQALLDDTRIIYGVNTGFGPLAQMRIKPDQAAQLSRNVILTSVSGVGPALSPDIVRAMMLIRINTFAKGLSGVRPRLAETLRQMLDLGVTPHVPSKGSLGASGDLAPLAHIAVVMSAGSDVFSGQAWFEGELLSGEEAMRRAGIERVELVEKEGLGLTNGTNFMVAALALGVHEAENLIAHAEIAAALSFEALLGISAALDKRLHAANEQPGQQRAAANLRSLLRDSGLVDSQPDRVQDAYSLRCTPQVIGPIRDVVAFLRERIGAALNAATDNPLFFLEGGEAQAISGGNFHGQGPALWLDLLGIAVAQLGTISERRVFRMTASELSEGLPPMLIQSDGLDSGLMMPQYTAAALVSDNKTLAHPDSVDSIPSSANQEDHVSMGANAARHTLEIIENVRHILAVELLTGAQAIDLRADGPAKLGVGTAEAHAEIREHVDFLEHDRPTSQDIERLAELISTGKLAKVVDRMIDR
jgi:histidine ammonia-lyase